MLDRPWAEMPRTGKAITQLQLSQILRGYGVKPRLIHLRGSDQIKTRGYLREAFEKAFRYIPSETPENTRYSVTLAENSQKSRYLAEDEVTGKMAENRQSNGVTGISTPPGGETHIDPFEALKDPSLALRKDDQ